MLLSLEEAVYLVSDGPDVSFYEVSDFKLPASARSRSNQHQVCVILVLGTKSSETLLDGAIVLNHHYCKPCFMVMDIVAHLGTRCSGTLTQRFVSVR
jgi:hypothetical protein